MKKMAILFLIFLLIASCTSNKYLIKTTEDIANNKRTEIICTHKKAIIPWFAGVAAGVVSFNYGRECEERITALSEPAFIPPPPDIRPIEEMEPKRTAPEK